MSEPAGIDIRVAIGLPVQNGARHLGQALESLLNQSYDHVAVLVVDNCSTDRTPEIVQHYVARVPRLEYVRNPEPLGMVANWRRTFELTMVRFGSPAFFAWGSDHDIWHPDWLDALVRELEADRRLVAAFPLAGAVAADGTWMRSKRRLWDTVEVADPAARARRIAKGVPVRAGNLAYALFRSDAVARAGIYPETLEPDRLLLARLCVLGPMKQVPRELWTRRFFGVKPTRTRQRARLFTGRAPVHAYLGTWLVHATALAHWLVVRGAARPETGRLRGLLIAAEYFVLAAINRLNRVFFRGQRKKTRRRLRKIRRSLAPRRVFGRALRAARRQTRLAQRIARSP